MKYIVELQGGISEDLSSFKKAVKCAKSTKKHYLQGGYRFYTDTANNKIRIFKFITTIGELEG
jgi:hypothetical protein